jgi:plastocyanin
MDLAHPTQFKIRKFLASRKAWHIVERICMYRFYRPLIGTVVVLASLVTTAQAQRVHEIRMEANPAKETFRFSPPLVTARPGDVLLFKAGPGVPHSIVFEGAGLNEESHEALNGAMSRRTGDLSSPLLTAEGAVYRMVVPQLAPGIYAFYCLPHRAYDMRAQLRVTK